MDCLHACSVALKRPSNPIEQRTYILFASFNLLNGKQIHTNLLLDKSLVTAMPVVFGFSMSAPVLHQTGQVDKQSPTTYAQPKSKRVLLPDVSNISAK